MEPVNDGVPIVSCNGNSPSLWVVTRMQAQHLIQRLPPCCQSFAERANALSNSNVPWALCAESNPLPNHLLTFLLSVEDGKQGGRSTPEILLVPDQTFSFVLSNSRDNADCHQRGLITRQIVLSFLRSHFLRAPPHLLSTKTLNYTAATACHTLNYLLQHVATDNDNGQHQHHHQHQLKLWRTLDGLPLLPMENGEAAFIRIATSKEPVRDGIEEDTSLLLLPEDPEMSQQIKNVFPKLEHRFVSSKLRSFAPAKALVTSSLSETNVFTGPTEFLCRHQSSSKFGNMTPEVHSFPVLGPTVMRNLVDLWDIVARDGFSGVSLFAKWGWPIILSGNNDMVFLVPPETTVTNKYVLVEMDGSLTGADFQQWHMTNLSKFIRKRSMIYRSYQPVPSSQFRLPDVFVRHSRDHMSLPLVTLKELFGIVDVGGIEGATELERVNLLRELDQTVKLSQRSVVWDFASALPLFRRCDGRWRSLSPEGEDGGALYAAVNFNIKCLEQFPQSLLASASESCIAMREYFSTQFWEPWDVVSIGFMEFVGSHVVPWFGKQSTSDGERHTLLRAVATPCRWSGVFEPQQVVEYLAMYDVPFVQTGESSARAWRTVDEVYDPSHHVFRVMFPNHLPSSDTGYKDVLYALLKETGLLRDSPRKWMLQCVEALGRLHHNYSPGGGGDEPCIHESRDAIMSILNSENFYLRSHDVEMIKTAPLLRVIDNEKTVVGHDGNCYSIKTLADIAPPKRRHPSGLTPLNAVESSSEMCLVWCVRDVADIEDQTSKSLRDNLNWRTTPSASVVVRNLIQFTLSAETRNIEIASPQARLLVHVYSAHLEFLSERLGEDDALATLSNKRVVLVPGRGPRVNLWTFVRGNEVFLDDEADPIFDSISGAFHLWSQHEGLLLFLGAKTSYQTTQLCSMFEGGLLHVPNAFHVGTAMCEAAVEMLSTMAGWLSVKYLKVKSMEVEALMKSVRCPPPDIFFKFENAHYDLAVPAHKFILSGASDYFYKLLCGGFAEAKAHPVVINMAPNECPLSLVLLLSFIYSGSIPPTIVERLDRLDSLSMELMLGVFALSDHFAVADAVPTIWYLIVAKRLVTCQNFEAVRECIESRPILETSLDGIASRFFKSFCEMNNARLSPP